MHMLVLMLMMSALSYDSLGRTVQPRWGDGRMLLAGVGPAVVLSLFMIWRCRRCGRKLRDADAPVGKLLHRLEREMLIVRLLALGSWLGLLHGWGWLQWVREAMGNWVVVDELLAIWPTLLVFIVPWWAYFPIDEFLRHRAGTTEPPGHRGRYVLMQVRHQILLVFAPLLLVMIWTELLDRWAAGSRRIADLQSVLSLGGLVVVFVFAPVVVRVLWHTSPLPAGPLRDRLLQLCRSYRVGVGQLLQWHTYGGMINGAVMGILGPLRYILLTDGLLAQMNTLEIEAVMAHEVGHVKRKHMIWLVLTAGATLYLIEAVLFECAFLLDSWLPWHIASDPAWTVPVNGVMIGLILLGWLYVFGWVSRRFERQADTFAVQHLSRKMPGQPGGELICSGAVEVYCQTLHRVAMLNNMAIDRDGWRSWRHGSIRWRCEYLRTLVDRPVRDCDIDQLVRKIRLLTACIIALLLLYHDVGGSMQWLAQRV